MRQPVQTQFCDFLVQSLDVADALLKIMEHVDTPSIRALRVALETLDLSEVFEQTFCLPNEIQPAFEFANLFSKNLYQNLFELQLSYGIPFSLALAKVLPLKLEEEALDDFSLDYLESLVVHLNNGRPFLEFFSEDFISEMGEDYDPEFFEPDLKAYTDYLQNRYHEHVTKNPPQFVRTAVMAIQSQPNHAVECYQRIDSIVKNMPKSVEPKHKSDSIKALQFALSSFKSMFNQDIMTDKTRLEKWLNEVQADAQSINKINAECIEYAQATLSVLDLPLDNHECPLSEAIANHHVKSVYDACLAGSKQYPQHFALYRDIQLAIVDQIFRTKAVWLNDEHCSAFELINHLLCRKDLPLDDLSEIPLKPGTLTVEILFARIKINLWEQGWSQYKESQLGSHLEDLIESKCQELLDWQEYLELIDHKPITLQSVFCHSYQYNRKTAPLSDIKTFLASNKVESKPQLAQAPLHDNKSQFRI